MYSPLLQRAKFTSKLCTLYARFYSNDFPQESTLKNSERASKTKRYKNIKMGETNQPNGPVPQERPIIALYLVVPRHQVHLHLLVKQIKSNLLDRGRQATNTVIKMYLIVIYF